MMGAQVVWSTSGGGIAVNYNGVTTAYFDPVAANCERSSGSDGSYKLAFYPAAEGAPSTVGCAKIDTQQ